jgi:hypothetical protein
MSTTLLDVAVPLATGTVGTLLGFWATRWNESLNEVRELKRAVQHISSELLNARRHYGFSRDENHAIGALPQWQRVVQLGKCRFYGNGLGSFEVSSLRLFKPKLAEQILDFMLVVRNNDFYIDQAIQHSGPAEQAVFDVVLGELMQRFDSTIQQADKTYAAVADAYPRLIDQK